MTFLSGFSIRVILSSYNELGSVHLFFHFGGSVYEELALILFKCLVEFNSEVIWSWLVPFSLSDTLGLGAEGLVKEGMGSHSSFKS